ncbi:MAG TPA: hypothetical protein VJ901_19220 [Thermoanaerobaculia bacterium]|nr:hypothetical protein [Thermoanaerobaculia bacterium]
MRRFIGLAVALLAVACADTREKVTLAFNEHGSVTITTVSPFEDNWKHRFDHVGPSSERITYEKAHGEIATVEHSALIANEDLQKFFSDVDMTIRLTNQDGINELVIYPATSSRATREERTEFHERVHVAAGAFVNYVRATRHLYDYLDAHPQRAESAFSQIFADSDEIIVAAESEEKDLIVDLRHAMTQVLDTAPEKDAQERFVNLADRVNDPFPGVITVTLPSQYSSIEGFKRIDSAIVRAEVTSPSEALAALEGRWVSPDPLAAALRSEAWDPVATAHQARHASLSVTADDVAKAFIEQIEPKPVYRVRWIARSADVSSAVRGRPRPRTDRLPGETPGDCGQGCPRSYNTLVMTTAASPSG